MLPRAQKYTQQKDISPTIKIPPFALTSEEPGGRGDVEALEEE